MSKVVDITEKLEFNESTKIKIKEKEVAVNTDATAVIKLMACMKDNESITPNTVIEMYEILFDEKDRDAIETLNLSFKDLRTLIEVATDMVIGKDEEEGE